MRLGGAADGAFGLPFMSPGAGEESRRSRRESRSFEDEQRRRLSEARERVQREFRAEQRSVQRVITNKDMDAKLKSLAWQPYLAHRKAMQSYLEDNGCELEANYLASLNSEVRNIIYSDCRQRNIDKLKFKSNGDSEFPIDIKGLMDLDFDKLDVLVRLSMRPANKQEFLFQMKKNVTFYTPDGFKAGILNFRTLYKSYQQLTENTRKLYVYMSFSDEPEFDKNLLPDVDGKGQSLVKTFREMLPKELDEYFFTVLPKPPSNRWNNFIHFLDAMDQVVHKCYTDFREIVLPFANIFHHGNISDRGGALKTISESMADHEMVTRLSFRKRSLKACKQILRS